MASSLRQRSQRSVLPFLVAGAVALFIVLAAAFFFNDAQVSLEAERAAESFVGQMAAGDADAAFEHFDSECSNWSETEFGSAAETFVGAEWNVTTQIVDASQLDRATGVIAVWMRLADGQPMELEVDVIGQDGSWSVCDFRATEIEG